jgi:predicted DNA-binding helix-hairpin-helix protein
VDGRFSGPAAATQRALERLAASGKTPEEVERSLARIDRKLLRAVEDVLSADERERIRAEVDRRLGGDAAGMDERALRRTRDVLVRHRLRALFRLPRLSLLS